VTEASICPVQLDNTHCVGDTPGLIKERIGVIHYGIG